MSDLIGRLAGDVDEPMRPGNTVERPGVQNIDRLPLGRPGLLACRTKQLQAMDSTPVATGRSTFLSTPIGDSEWEDGPIADRFDY
jgi:hypothetical protein